MKCISLAEATTGKKLTKNRPIKAQKSTVLKWAWFGKDLKPVVWPD
jgi:hypothetical protein